MYSIHALACLFFLLQGKYPLAVYRVQQQWDGDLQFGALNPPNYMFFFIFLHLHEIQRYR